MFSKILRLQMYNEQIVKDGHFILASGKHSDTYVQKDRMVIKPTLRHTILSLMTSAIIPIRDQVDGITGPAAAGLAWASPIADRLHLPLVYPEKTLEGTMSFGREFPEFIKGKKLLQIEDIITTSKSVNLTKNAIEECGGECGGVVCIWNRGDWEPPEHWFYRAMVTKNINSYIKEICPDCDNPDNPLTDPKTDKIIAA